MSLSELFAAIESLDQYEYMEYIVVAVILFASAADAVRDAWMSRFRSGPKGSREWRLRHRAKWAAYYPPLIALMILHVPLLWWIPLLPVSWLVWQMSARHIGGVDWKSHLRR